MREENYLILYATERWFDTPSKKLSQHRKNVSKSLSAIADLLTQTSKKIDYGNVCWTLCDFYKFQILEKDRERAQDLYFRVAEAGGTSTSRVQKCMLDLIAWAANPASIPFWTQCVEFIRPRDQFTLERRRIAMAALASLVILKQSEAARQAIVAFTEHELSEIRAIAIQSLDQLYAFQQQEPPQEIVDKIEDIAKHDGSFFPRFMARKALILWGREIPIDNVGGTYVFKVNFKSYKKMYREIELRSEQTFYDLAASIQRSIGWDNDHLYAFYLNGKKYDSTFEVTGSFGWGVTHDGDDVLDESTPLGMVGFVKKQTFLYFFDFGDNHQFDVQVVNINPTAEENAKYPRVIKSEGRAPKQYRSDEFYDE